MTEMLKQSLSAAMDNEADAFELRRVLDELDRDVELRGVWERYHLIGSALRGEHRGARPGTRDRIWLAIDGATDAVQAAEVGGVLPVEVAPAGRSGTAARWRIKPRTALAAAATVTLAVLFGTGTFTTDGDSPVPTLAGAELSGLAAVTVADASTAASTGASTDASARLIPESATTSTLSGPEIPASDLQRAHAYMLHHTQQQAMSQSSVMSLVKLATYEAP